MELKPETERCCGGVRRASREGRGPRGRETRMLLLGSWGYFFPTCIRGKPHPLRYDLAEESLLLHSDWLVVPITHYPRDQWPFRTRVYGRIG